MFTPGLLISYRSFRELSSYLVRTKLYHIDKIVRSKGCDKKRCKVCVNLCETDTFSGKTFKLNCDDKCLIYLITGECCGKQYVGEITGELRFRWNNYKCSGRKYTRNEDCLQEHWLRHFHGGKHTGFLGNVKITLIDKTDVQNTKKKKLLEENSWE